MQQKSAITAVLLIAHGSRQQAANEDLEEVARMIRARNAYDIIEISYLELVAPTIRQGARNCIIQGACRVLLLPYFLSAGTHVTQDLQQHCQELSDEFADASFILCPPLGLHPSIVDVVFHRLREAIDQNSDSP